MSYNVDSRPDGKYKMIQKNFILPDDKYQNQSSYTEEYNKKGARPAEKIVPVGQLTLSKQPFQAHSSYIDDYLNRGQGQRAEKMAVPKNFVMPEGKFDGGSNYSQNYIGGRPQRQQQFRPVCQLKIGGNFQGVSSYLADFQNKGAGIKAQRMPLPKNQVFPEGRFQGNTNYTSNYLPTRSEKLQQFKPQGQIKLGGNFQGSSSYGADYNAKGLITRAQKYPLPQNQVMPDGKFQGNSNYAQNYIPNRAQRQKQIKPQGELKIGGDFQGNTSYLADYANKGSGLKAERVAPPKNMVLPEGKFEGDSVYTSNYIPTKIQRRQQIRPEGQIKIGGNFQGTSSYLVDYQNKGILRRAERAPLPQNQVMPLGKFQGNTAYNSDYINSIVQKNHQIRPIGQLKVGEGKFQGQSSYSNDYLNKGTPGKVERVPLAKNHIMPQGKFQSTSTYAENYIPAQIKKQNFPSDQHSAPRYQVVSTQHVRWNAKTHCWQ